MKKTTTLFATCQRWIVGSLLALLGFSACLEEVIDDPNKGGYDMYGSPTTDFIVTGRVTDEAGNPIRGIAVKPFFGNLIDPQMVPVAYADQNGMFKMDTLKGLGPATPPILFTDEDGSENGGEFLNDTLRYPEFERTLLEKGSGWHEGLYELKAEVKLIKKE